MLPSAGAAASSGSSARRHFFLCSSSCTGLCTCNMNSNVWQSISSSSLTILGWQLVTGTSLHSSHEISLQSGRLWVSQDVVLLTWCKGSSLLSCVSGLASQVKVLVILTSSTTSGSWYHSSLPSVQLISGTMNLTFLGTSLHSCQVTGSQASLPAHTCRLLRLKPNSVGESKNVWR